MHTVVETPSFLKAAEKLFTAAEREQIVTMVSSVPDCGELIQGTGGFRKVRVGRGSSGKSGGARVVYILHSEVFPVFLVAAYAKNEKANLTRRERNELAKLAESIFAKYRR
ncbi:MAG: type II toxin-antitoxin system RelE/ParE family toxin [Ignavibacteriota bacterium]